MHAAFMLYKTLGYPELRYECIMLKMKSECASGSDSSLWIGNPSIMLMPDKCIYKKARGLCHD